jgi:signal transduction histidine kinase
MNGLEQTAISDIFVRLQPLVQNIARSRNVHELAQASISAIGAMIDVEFTGFYFVNPWSGKLELLVARGLTEDERTKAEASASARHPGLVMQSKKTYLSNDETSAEVQARGSYSDRVVIASRLYCPIVHGDTCTGTLGLASSRKGTFSEAHASIIEFIASVVAVTHAQILNSSLVHDTLSRMIHLIDSMHAGVLLEDEQRRVLHTNPQFRRIFNIPEEAAPHLVGSDCDAGLHQFKGLFVDEEQFVARVYAVLKERQRVHGDRLNLKDGRTLERDYIPVIIDGKFRGTLWNYQDVSKALELNQQYERAKQQIEEERLRSIHSAKMASLGEMAGGIAHEINTPLAVITTLSDQLAELAEGRIQGTLSEPISDDLILGHSSTIEGTARRIAHIIRGMRIFARDGSTDAEVDFDLQEILGDTLALCTESLKAHQIFLETRIPDAMIIRGRPVECSQVLLNLINNAKDAVRILESPWIRIEARRLTDQDKIEISISDSGRGVAPAVREKLFQPFFTTKPVGQGTGLGLGISKKIIERHGGDIRLDETSPNTRFVILLPTPRT